MTGSASGTDACPNEADARSEGLVSDGRQHLERGDPNRARACAHEAIELSGDNPAAHRLLADLEMPGPRYTEVLRRLHDHLRPATYVEIGVAKGDSLKLVGSQTRVLGIDPRPCIGHDVAAAAKLFPTTSDLFFERFDVTEELGVPTVDLVFIDGLHLFEFVLRDFIHMERFCSPRTVVAVHDCYPITHRVALRQRETKFWTGDVWKLVPCLRDCRPDLHIHTVATPPSGLVLITGCDPTSTVLTDDLGRITETYMAQVWDPDRAVEVLNLVPNNWDQIAKLLPDADS